MYKKALWGTVLLYVLNVLDALSTFWAISVMKIATEYNPLMRYLLDISPYLFLAVKILAVPAWLFFSLFLAVRSNTLKWYIVTLVPMVFLYIYIVISNFSGIFRYLLSVR